MKHYLALFIGLLFCAPAFGEGQIACQEPIRTICINSCGTSLCRASCEHQYCGPDVQPSPSPTPAPNPEDGFPDTDRYDIVCDNDLGETLQNTLLPIYRQSNLLYVYKTIFKVWNCSLQPKPWTLQAGPQVNPWAGSDPQPPPFSYDEPGYPPIYVPAIPPPPPPGCFNPVWAGQWFCQGNGGWNAGPMPFY